MTLWLYLIHFPFLFVSHYRHPARRIHPAESLTAHTYMHLYAVRLHYLLIYRHQHGGAI